jgi:hypothetical protein
VAGATPFPKVGGRTTPFLAKGWLRPPHTGRMGVAEATPGLWGWSGHPKRPPKKKKKGKNGFWPLGVAGPPPRATPLRPAVRSHPQALGGGPATPKGQNPFPPPPFFFFGPFGVAGPPPKAWGGFGHPHTAGMGWPKPPLGQKWGGPATPLLGRGWLQPPRFPILFFFFFF